METKRLDLYQGQILPWQERAVEDEHRFKVIVAGRKARKTTFIVNRLIKAAATDPRGLTYPYIAPFRKQAKEIVWDDHLGRLLRLFKEFGIAYKANMSDLTVRFANSTFMVTGADNAEALRGKSDWGGVGLDEYASWKPYVWQEIIRPNLQVHRGWGIIGGTPKGYGNNLYKMAKMGDHERVIDDAPSELDPDFFTFHATSYDNIYLPDGEVDSAKREASPEWFNQEYLALFTRFTGLVYPEFVISEHVEEFDHPKNRPGDYYFGQDFAVRGFTAMIVGYVDDKGEIWVLDEYKENNGTAQAHIEAEKLVLDRYADLRHYVGYADPAGWINNQQGLRHGREMVWSLANEYTDADMPLVAGNNEVAAGINYLRQLFRNHKIHINPRCVKLIDELQQYQWKDQSEKQKGLVEEPEKVRKINDHLVDALRYMCYSKPSPAEIPQKANYFPGMPLKFELKVEEKPIDPDGEFTPINIPSIYG